MEIEDECLKRLAHSLPDVILAAKAPSTNEKYRNSWKGWLDWCDGKKEVNAIPAEPFYVAIYLNFTLETANNKGALTAAFYGIRWGHHVNGFLSPTDHPFVQMAFEGCIRLCDKKPKTPKDPITPEIMKFLMTKYASETLPEMRFLLICAFGFFGFFRIEELLSVKLKDIEINETHLKIFLEKAKNDQHRDGNIIYISRLDSEFCPVKLLERFLEMARLTISEHQNTFLIPRLIKYKSGHKPHLTLGIAYSRAREIFLEKFKDSEIDGNFGLHSLRSGGTSAAANNNVDERLISKHGRWKSDKARNSYIKDSVQKRLTVTRQLGI